jgi:Domain of unknown function (DUF2017)
VIRRSRVKRLRKGGYRLDLPAAERDVVRRLLPQLRELLTDPDPDPRVRRLFPVAHPDDPAAQAEFELLVHDDLVASRLAAIDEVEATLDAQELTDEQLMAWMQALNAVRLVLGTILDVSEDDSGREVDDDDPDAGTWALYGYLSFLLDQLVDAASP